MAKAVCLPDFFHRAKATVQIDLNKILILAKRFSMKLNFTPDFSLVI